MREFDIEDFCKRLKEAQEDSDFNRFRECIWYGRVLQLFVLDLISLEEMKDLEKLVKEIKK